MRHVIIGNSTAAVGAVEGIRRIDRQSEITIISAESRHVYSRPLISYLLMGKTDENRMKYRGDDFYRDNGCRVVHARATGIDTAAKRVVLEDGTSLPYDKLMNATGSSPLLPPLEGLEGVNDKFTFMTLADAQALEKALRPAARVLIIGAGLIGLKCAEGIAGRVGSICVADLAPRVLSSVLDEVASGLVQSHLEDKGLEFRLSRGAARFKGNVAVMTDGEEIPFDILVLAVGVRPNVELVRDAGGVVGRGILVDAGMCTTLPDVYAAGDCTEGYDISSGQSRIMALLPNAYMQGECAGINMAGGDCRFDKAMPMNAVGFFGMHIITAGSYEGEVYSETGGAGCYKKLFYKDDALKGYIMAGDVEKAGIYTSLIRERTPLSSIDFDLVCKAPGLMAFSREERTRKLGGAAV